MECILTPYKETADFLNISALLTTALVHFGSFLSKVVSWVRHLLASIWQ